LKVNAEEATIDRSCYSGVYIVNITRCTLSSRERKKKKRSSLKKSNGFTCNPHATRETSDNMLTYTYMIRVVQARANKEHAQKNKQITICNSSVFQGTKKSQNDSGKFKASYSNKLWVGRCTFSEM
jgi:hypothetical protein